MNTDVILPKDVDAQHLTAGDIIELKTPKFEDGVTVSSEIEESLKKGPVKWGDGRILYIKKDPQTDGVLIGLTSYKPGTFEIKPIEFKKNGTVVFSTDPKVFQFIEIKSGPDNEPFPPQSIPYPTWALIVLVLLGLVAVGIVSFFGHRYWKKRKKKVVVAPVVDKTPYQIFIEKIKHLEKQQYLKDNNYKPHYFGLSNALKEYIGSTYGFDAEESTTREMLIKLESEGCSPQDVSEWKAFFSELDVVKFTDTIPNLEEAQTLVKRCYELVGKTK
ncbi:MAG: hypothetical protein AB7F43_02715 [Bacteriovoracia bacterium]